MRLSDFDYHLPQEMIAQKPADPRDSSKLMVLDRNEWHHHAFLDLPRFLRPGDLLVLNNSRVIPARLFGIKETGGRLEVLLVKRLDDKYYECLVRGKVKVGAKINFTNISGTLEGRVDSPTGYRYHIRFQCEGDFMTCLLEVGVMPVPPYIKEELEDGERYQTIYSRCEGSIAAPTAGLHFTPQLIDTIERMGVKLAFVTLHVGVGTFMPVRAEDVEEHTMESEYFIIDEDTTRAINDTIEIDGRIIVVGTTTVRALESAQWLDGRIVPSRGWSEIFIHPPYQFRTPMSGIITNFHLPKSTLLMLISAYAGKDAVLAAYKEAIDNGYRFYSFGDAMFILDNKKSGDKGLIDDTVGNMRADNTKMAEDNRGAEHV
ncbi:MAG: tRNA preQ1(34) S-adenosylmethionine ribosyltransferase-isomerase QueA [ANME-2 cluster archaeon]|nr:tRNA preQ1(34) S-adenosylmethionine ribosyltransferase-isomerase QueA [ANME-2 cluster archaeon]MDF1530791.1 tRNA preQ1(34) S-adenosylmethionine ribosyltransferase-isomerase QueA [ANME-2 cluster archaeon]